MTRKNGFYLVELLVVIAVVGILAAVAIPNFQRFQARVRACERNPQGEGCRRYVDQELRGPAHTEEIYCKGGYIYSRVINQYGDTTSDAPAKTNAGFQKCEN